MRERGKCDECEAPCERCNDFPIIKRAKAEATRKERERCAEVARRYKATEYDADYCGEIAKAIEEK